MAGLVAALLWPSPSIADAARSLRFSLHSQPISERSLGWLRERVPARTVRVFDPYEGVEVAFEALRFDAVLDTVYGPGWREQEEILFTCADGYQPTLPVQRVRDHDAWLAWARVDAPAFEILKRESGERRRIALAPFYLVWENLKDDVVRIDGDYGWPYQLVGVDLIRTRERFPSLVPPADADAPVQSGFRAFRIHCSRCHAIGGEGGTIGPELNGAARPIELRERAWLRRWIDDPSRILSNARMPRLNPALPQRERLIDDILAYLAAISEAHPHPTDEAR